MIAGLIVILTMTAAGLPLTALVAPSQRPRAFLGISYLLGSAWCAILLFVLSTIGVKWSVTVLAIGALVPIAFAAPFAARSLRDRSPAVSAVPTPASRAVDFLTIFTVAGYALYATIAPMWEWDFWSLWGLNARAFLERSGIDWEFLSRPENFLAHYSTGTIAFRPILHPLLLDAFAVASGTWDDRIVGLVFVAFAAAVLLVVRDEMEKDSGSPAFAAFVTLGATGIATTRWVGNPEGMLVAYFTIAILLTRRALRSNDALLLAAGAIFAGLAALTKDEGATFVVALIGGVVAMTRNRKMIVALLPAIVLPLPWWLLRHSHGLTDTSSIKPLGVRISSHLSNPGELLSALATNLPDHPLFWIGVVIALVACIPRALKEERFATVTLALQFCFYVAAYVTTPFNVQWHVATSWVRLLYQLAPALMYVTLALLLPVIGLAKEREIREPEALVTGA